MSEQSSKSFLNVLARSGLIEPERIKTLLAEFQKNAKQVGDKKLSKFVEHLIKSDLITDWHLEKLKSGKYKGFFLGKYKLLGHLGTGGMSSVYLAEHSIMKNRRAIKVLPRKRVSDKSYLERFYREGRAAASLNHKNIARVYDIDSDADTHYLVMEFVDGMDLYDQVKKNGPLPADKAIKYTIEALQGLNHAHANQLVHRDIKPANLLLSKDNVVKLLDMGLALFREEEESLTMAHNEKVIGTADYLAPEQAINSHDVDHRADIYAMGCTLYFFLTGKPPFSEGTLAQRIALHQTSEPDPIERSDCPPALMQVLNAMMQKDPAARYQNCEQVIKDLTAISKGAGISQLAQQATISELPGLKKKPPKPGAAKPKVETETGQNPATAENKSQPNLAVPVVDVTPEGEEAAKPVTLTKQDLSTIPANAQKNYRRKRKNNLANIILTIFVIGMLLVLVAVLAIVSWVM